MLKDSPCFMVGLVSSTIYEPVDLLSFRTISALCWKNNPWNINYMSVVIFTASLDFKRKI